jgi:EAL domain-containing protein (putative c-di-GMP-specific phosphodiesterase class I)
VAEERALFSPYTQESPYWIILSGADAAAVTRFGGAELHHQPDLYGFATTPRWTDGWTPLAEEFLPVPHGGHLRAAVIAADSMPSLQEIELSLRPAEEIDAVARNLWLANYLNEGRLICFMQRLIDRRNKQVGFEAFARMEAPDGNIIGGGAIMQASHALHLEYQVDRLMHKQAIQCFVESDLEGFLFINFLTGFIHRPEVYLEGLSQAVDRHHLVSRAVALDVPLIDYAHNITKLKSIANYCHARGFALSLDDVMSTDGLASLLHEIRPAFVKLDAKLGVDMLDPKRQGTVIEIIRLAHSAGASVLAEGVESDALYNAYLSADVDMFQGYLFGAPERCPPPAKSRAAS